MITKLKSDVMKPYSSSSEENARDCNVYKQRQIMADLPIIALFTISIDSEKVDIIIVSFPFWALIYRKS